MNLHRILTLLLLLAGLNAYGQLPLPAIPADLTRPADRADYLAAHFYDEMNWNDSAMVSLPNLMQDWANYLSVLPHCSPAGRDSSIVATMHAVPAREIPTYFELSDDYLFAVDSELCDETTYVKVCRALASHPGIDPSIKSAIQSRLEYLSHGAAGSTAVDIEVEMLDDSATARLADCAGKAAKILLVFYDPDCNDCHDTLATLKFHPDWITPQRQGELLVVKAMITDETDATYALLSTPSLYLLDGRTLTVKVRNVPLQGIAAAL